MRNDCTASICTSVMVPSQVEPVPHACFCRLDWRSKLGVLLFLRSRPSIAAVTRSEHVPAHDILTSCAGAESLVVRLRASGSKIIGLTASKAIPGVFPVWPFNRMRPSSSRIGASCDNLLALLTRPHCWRSWTSWAKQSDWTFRHCRRSARLISSAVSSPLISGCLSSFLLRLSMNRETQAVDRSNFG